MGQRRDPSRHLRKDDDADDPEKDRPCERHAEPCARHRRGDDVSDVQKPPDGSQDAEGDTEELLHRSCTSTKSLSFLAELWSGFACLASSSKSARRAAMRASLSAFAALTQSKTS